MAQDVTRINECMNEQKRDWNEDSGVEKLEWKKTNLQGTTV